MQTTHSPHGRTAPRMRRGTLGHAAQHAGHAAAPGKAKEREEGPYAAGAKKGSLPLTSHAESGYARMPGSS